MGKQLLLNIHRKKIVDGFAGIGGMSIAFEQAFGRSPDIAFNHNDDAVSCHRLNHPTTRHFIADAYEVCPKGAMMGDEVGWFHYSPDCTHFSQASGGQPRSKRIRGLSWSGFRWAGQVKPDVISLENVLQILKWGPLVAKRDAATGRCLKRVVDAKGKATWVVAEKGERVPLQDQYLVPDPKREGETWKKFVRKLEAMGYVVDSRILVAANLGGHTTRKRLFMIARRDGYPIVWPEQTHFAAPKGRQSAHAQAADCIDFSDLGRSIFGRKKELAVATKRRLAKGIKRFVLDNPTPFIVNNMTHNAPRSVLEPMAPACTGGHKMLVTPSIVPIAHYNGRDTVHGTHEPLRTVTAATKGGEFALACPIVVPAPQGVDAGPPAATSAFVMQANDGFNATVGRGLEAPFTSITATGSQQQLVALSLAQLRTNCDARDLREPVRTISAGGEHHGLVSAFLSCYGGEDDAANDASLGAADEAAPALTESGLAPQDEAGALRVAAFLMEYYSEGGQWSPLDKPINTITTRDRLALVTVLIKGDPYVIVDIRLRMLKPRELARGQDFPDEYVIDRGHDGREFSVATQVRMIGNSVNPKMAIAFLRANAPWLAARQAA